MYTKGGGQQYTREQLIRKLSASERNHIAVFWSGVNPGDGCFTGGSNLVTHDPYYAGWGGSIESQSEHINYAELELIKDICDARPWGTEFGGKCLGGVEYYLNPEERVEVCPVKFTTQA